jgi:hypothetical protein
MQISLSTISLWLVLLAAPCLPAFAQGRGNAGLDQTSVTNGWMASYEEAKAIARRDKKPMMIVLRCVP